MSEKMLNPPWHRACSVKELSDAEPHGVTISNVPVAIFKIDDVCYATHNVCTHAYALLSEGFVEDHIIECPLHGAKYDIRTGKCLAVADSDLATFPVKVIDGDVFINLP
jgi:nitrite reductase/ring-hydroxylating ferredoxin subunit